MSVYDTLAEYLVSSRSEVVVERHHVQVVAIINLTYKCLIKFLFGRQLSAYYHVSLRKTLN